MSTHKSIDRICVVITVLSLVLTILFINGQALGIQAGSQTMGYEETLFDTSKVHTIDIVIDDWDAFLETCESETYSACSVVIDNEAVKNVAIRGKGNTSLSTVKTLDSERYSFKIEFDQYENGKNYHGLDKLSLNNLIQDNTYLKDYLTYRMMDEFGADAPLCSFAYITINGEDWGLYLAVEGVEDSFLQRNYGKDSGELYKPDSMSFGGGGPGNGRDFDFEDFLNRNVEEGETEEDNGGSDVQPPEMPEGFDPSQFFGEGEVPHGSGFPDGEMPGDFDFPGSGDSSDGSGFPGGRMPGGFAFPGNGNGSDSSGFPGGEMPEGMKPPAQPGDGSMNGAGRMMGGFEGGGMGSADVKLQYTDDDADSYSNIFDNAKTDVSKADQSRLIQALKKLSSKEDIQDTVDVDEVIRYFVVHNFVCNGDSYTGSIIHNYYLYEEDGQFSMIPWDYNLAFGTFQGADATDSVNDPIDTPMSVSNAEDRPMWGWIADSAEYLQMYHEYFAEFLDTVDITGIIDEAAALISPYVEKDPTAFCTYEEFEKALETLCSFCSLRIQSVRGQLEGSVPATDEGQRTDSSALIDASSLTLSDMGSMGGQRGGGAGFGERPSSGGAEARIECPDDPSGSSGGVSDSGNPDEGDQQNITSPEQGNDSFSPPGQSSGGSRGNGKSQSPGGNPTDRDISSFTPPAGFAGLPGQTGSATSGKIWILTGISTAILAVGVLTALKYKRC